jgi:hypothetical protein
MSDTLPSVLTTARLRLRPFTQEGFMPERWIVHGEKADTAFYGLLKRYWDERAPSRSSAAAAG